MKKKTCLFAAAVLAIGTIELTGGSYPVMASENLLADAVMNLEEADSVKGSLDILTKMGTEELSVATNMSVDMEELRAPQLYHISGELGMDMFDLSMTMESYGEVQDDAAVIYTYDDMLGEWMKYSTDIETMASVKSMMNLDAFLETDKEWTVEEETTVYNDQEVYVVTSTYAGVEFNEYLQKMCGMISDGLSLDMDFENVTMQVEIKVYKDSLLPAAVTMTVAEDEVQKVMSGGTEMELTEFSCEVQVQEYDTLESIEIPEEALAAESSGMEEEGTEEVSYVQDAEGNYVLTDFEEKASVAVAPLEGYAISEYANSTYLSFLAGSYEDAEGWKEISYYLTELNEEWTEENLKEAFASQKEFLTEENGFYDVQLNDYQVMNAGDREIHYASALYSDGGNAWYKQYNAYAVLDNGFAIESYISEEVYDGGSLVTNEDTVKKVFEAVQ